MLDIDALTQVLGCSHRFLLDLRRTDPTFPVPRMLGTNPRWTYESIHAWVEQPARDAAALASASPAESSSPVPPARPTSRKRGGQRVH
jgi:predicted DNA-binding transcriptional regulator AlpA